MEHENQPAKQIYKEKYLKRVEVFDAALLKRLKGLTPDFLEMRQKMGFGETVGFASFPDSHGVYAMGTLPYLEKKADKLYYQVTGFFAPEKELVTPEIAQRILVMPDLNQKPHLVVSIYQRKGFFEEGEIEEELLKATDDVFIGVIAHELSHMFEFRIKKPKFLKDFLKEKRKAVEKFVGKNRPWAILCQSSLEEECLADITAGLFGFKKQVLAKNQYMRECLRNYQGADDTSYSLARKPGVAIQEVDLRTKAVLKFCK